MSLYSSCPCGIPEGSPEPHVRTDCPLYGMTGDSNIVSTSDRLARRMGGRFRVSALSQEPPLDTIQRLGQEMEQADQADVLRERVEPDLLFLRRAVCEDDPKAELLVRIDDILSIITKAQEG